MKEMRRLLTSLGLLLTLFALVLPVPSFGVEVDVSLRGSPNSMVRQNSVAKSHGFDFVRSSADVDSLLEDGTLVPLPGNDFYVINDGVSYPVARPEVRLFVERLAEQYYEGTGEKLVVTSLMRPTSEQPRNSHKLSVHPTGIAIDFRVSSQRKSRAWLEAVLIKLERRGLLDITRERWPPHYHVALFPEEYRGYIEQMIGADEVAEAMRFEVEEPEQEEKSLAEKVFAPATKKVAATAVIGQKESPWFLILVAGPVAVLLLSLFMMRQEAVEENLRPEAVEEHTPQA